LIIICNYVYISVRIVNYN